jgi:hypothetical protein
MLAIMTQIARMSIHKIYQLFYFGDFFGRFPRAAERIRDASGKMPVKNLGLGGTDRSPRGPKLGQYFGAIAPVGDHFFHAFQLSDRAV